MLFLATKVCFADLKRNVRSRLGAYASPLDRILDKLFHLLARSGRRIKIKNKNQIKIINSLILLHYLLKTRLSL